MRIVLRIGRGIAIDRSYVFFSALVWVVLLNCHPNTLEAQLPLRYENLGMMQSDGLGFHLRRGGDFNGDGFRDYLAAIPHDSSLGNSHGSVRLYSGVDGILLFTVLPPSPTNSPSQDLGASVCDAGDVDADGCSDVLAYAINVSGGSLFLFSGSTGNILLTTGNLGLIPGNYILDTVKDLNGDGIRDVVLLNRNPWTLRILSGSDHSPLLFIDYQNSPASFFPHIVRNAGDVNGDGIDDLILGAPFFPAPSNVSTLPPGTGAVTVISSLDGSIIHSLQGPPPVSGPFGPVLSEFGHVVDGLGDLDGDGYDDFAIGAPGDGLGSIRVHSGFDASLMATLIGSSLFDRFGRSLSRCGDMNGDGVPDLAVGDWGWDAPGSVGGANANQGRILIYSGADFSLLFSEQGDLGRGLGDLIMGLGDLNGDGFPEVGCSIFDNTIAPGNGGVRVYSFGGTRSYGEGLGGLQTLNQIWFPGLGADPAQGAIVCSGGIPGALGFFGLSLQAADTSVMGVPVLIDDDPQALILTQPFVFDGQGKFAAVAPIRYPAFAGALVRSQFFCLTFPFASSNGMEFLLLP